MSYNNNSLERKRSFNRRSKKATDYFTTGLKDDFDLPTFFINCVNFLEEHALDEEGILRIHGRTQDTNAINAFLSSSEKRATSLGQVDPHAVATLLKSYLNQGPPLLPMTQYSTFVEIGSKKDADGEVLLLLRDVISGIPLTHQRVLHRVLIMIDNVQKHSSKNKMDAKALAIIFNPLLLRAPTEVSPAQILSQTQSCINCVLLLINNYEAIFDGIGLHYFDSPTSPILTNRDGTLRDFSSAKDKVKMRFVFYFTVKTGGCIRDTVSLFLKYSKQAVKRETGQTTALVCTNPQEVVWEDVVPLEVTLVVNKRTKVFESRNFIVTLKSEAHKGSKTLGAASINLAELAPPTWQTSPREELKMYEMLHKGGKKGLILQVKSHCEWRKVNNKLVVRQDESNSSSRSDSRTGHVTLRNRPPVTLMSMPNLANFDPHRVDKAEDEKYPLSARDHYKSESIITTPTKSTIPENPFPVGSSTPPSIHGTGSSSPTGPPSPIFSMNSHPPFENSTSTPDQAKHPNTTEPENTTTTTTSNSSDSVPESLPSALALSSDSFVSSNDSNPTTNGDSKPSTEPYSSTTNALKDSSASIPPPSESSPANDANAAIETKLGNNSNPPIDSNHAESKSASERKPATESSLPVESKPTSDSQFVDNSKPASDAKPTSDPKPTNDAKPTSEPKQTNNNSKPSSDTKTTPRDSKPTSSSKPTTDEAKSTTNETKSTNEAKPTTNEAKPSTHEANSKPPTIKPVDRSAFSDGEQNRTESATLSARRRRNTNEKTNSKPTPQENEEKSTESSPEKPEKESHKTRERSHSHPDKHSHSHPERHSHSEKGSHSEKSSHSDKKAETLRTKHRKRTDATEEPKKEDTKKVEIKETKKEETKKEETKKEETKKEESTTKDASLSKLNSIMRNALNTSSEIGPPIQKREKRLTINTTTEPTEPAPEHVSPTDENESDIESDNDFDGMNSVYTQKLFELAEQIELLQQQRRQLELETFNLRKCLVHNEIYRPQTLDFSERGIASTAEQIIENLFKMNCFLEPHNFPPSFFDSIIISLQQESKNEVEIPKILYWLSTTLGLLYLLSMSIKSIPDPSILGVVALTQSISPENGEPVVPTESSNANLLHFARGIQRTGLELYNKVLKIFEKQLDDEKLVLAFLGRPKEKEEKRNFVIKEKEPGMKTPEPVLTPAVALKEVLREINENYQLLKDAKIFENFAWHMALHRLFYLDHLLVHELSAQKKLYSTDAQTIKQATAEIEQRVREKFPSHKTRMPCPLKMTTQFVALVTAEYSKLDSETYINNSFTLLKPSQIFQILEVLRPDKDSRKPVPASVLKLLHAMIKSEAEKPRLVPMTWHLSDEITKLANVVR